MPETKTEPRQIQIPGDDLDYIGVELERLRAAGAPDVTERKVLLYWLRLGRKTEPKIKGLLT